MCGFFVVYALLGFCHKSASAEPDNLQNKQVLYNEFLQSVLRTIYILIFPP